MVEALGLSVSETIFAIANFLILLFVLIKFLYKPFTAMLDKRAQTIQDSLTHADEVSRQADERLAEYEAQIADAEAKGREIIKDAREKADAQAQYIIDEANAKASSIIAAAQKRVEEEKAMAAAEMKTQIADLALLAAEKVLENSVQAEGHDRIIDEIIEQAGVKGWQN